MTSPVKPRAQDNELIVLLLSFVLNLFGWIMFAFCISIVCQCVGMAFAGWSSTRPEKIVTEEINFIKSSCDHSPICGASFRWYSKNIEQRWISNLAKLTQKFRLTINNLTSSEFLKRQSTQETKLHYAKNRFSECMAGVIQVAKLFIIRLIILLSALPSFTLLGIIGLTDGIVQRSLRRAKGGRESALIYHHARSAVTASFISSWVIYLLLPISIHPQFILLPFAMLFGLSLWLCAKSFKKYW